jgi:soluble lytic murein transglycosylase-like protein
VLRRLFALFGAIALTGAAAPALASDDGLAAYAATLRVFDPALAAADAWRLAARVVGEADRAGIDARLVVALVAVESSWDVAARSPAGARGLGQLMPGTAAELGVDPADPEANLHGTVVYLRALLVHYAGLPPAAQYTYAVAAYNAGPGAVDRFGGIPPFPETQAYVGRVFALWRRLVSG